MITAKPSQSPIEALPRNIATSSILPFITSNDWLHFRLASRSCYEFVHSTADDLSNAFLPITGQALGSDGISAPRKACSSSAKSGGGIESETLWRLALARDYQFEEGCDERILHQSIHSPGDPQSDPFDPRSDPFLSTSNLFTAPNSFVAWKHWRKIDLHLHCSSSLIPSSERLVGPYFLRACSLWQKIEQWCEDGERSGTLGREIKSSLSPGRALFRTGPVNRAGTAEVSAYKAVYAFYAGQRDPVMNAVPVTIPPRPNLFDGLFGGFQAYHFISNTRWVEPEFETGQTHTVIAQEARKAIVMDLESGQMYCWQYDEMQRLVATPCLDGISQVHDQSSYMEKPTNPLESKASILRWFEEHARRLERNFYSAGRIILPHVPDGYASLMRYPTVADTANCSRAVTRGVETVVSAIFVPEMGMFVYSIRLRLLTPEDGEGYMSPEQRGFETCQLVSRYWKISTSSPNGGNAVVDEVRGDGVIGLYPLLHEGGYTNYDDDSDEVGHGIGAFSYQSCTEGNAGSMEGSLQFRPGSLVKPCGPIFNARVDPFPLEFSQYIY